MRIKGVNIPDKKHLNIALTDLYGIGRTRAEKILTETKIAFSSLAKELNADQEKRVRALAESYITEGDLRKNIGENIKRLKEIKSYRGTRHTRGLPARGQQTKTNSRTRRGNVRVTMGSGRKKVEKK